MRQLTKEKAQAARGRSREELKERTSPEELAGEVADLIGELSARRLEQQPVGSKLSKRAVVREQPASKLL